jgi:hypothetical protein
MSTDTPEIQKQKLFDVMDAGKTAYGAAVGLGIPVSMAYRWAKNRNLAETKPIEKNKPTKKAGKDMVKKAKPAKKKTKRKTRTLPLLPGASLRQPELKKASNAIASLSSSSNLYREIIRLSICIEDNTVTQNGLIRLRDAIDELIKATN